MIKQPENVVDYNHAWLYAKNHYKRSKNIARDIGIIFGKRSGLGPEYFDRHPAEVLDQLAHLAYDAIQRSGNPEIAFYEFIRHCSPEENWKVGGKMTHDIFGRRKKGVRSESYATRTIRACLSVMKLTSVKNDKGETILELGEPDPDILPLSENRKKQDAAEKLVSA